MRKNGAPWTWMKFKQGLVWCTVTLWSSTTKRSQQNWNRKEQLTMSIKKSLWDLLSKDFLIRYFISGLRKIVRLKLLSKWSSSIKETVWLAKLEKEKAIMVLKFKIAPIPMYLLQAQRGGPGKIYFHESNLQEYQLNWYLKISSFIKRLSS